MLKFPTSAMIIKFCAYVYCSYKQSRCNIIVKRLTELLNTTGLIFWVANRSFWQASLLQQINAASEELLNCEGQSAPCHRVESNSPCVIPRLLRVLKFREIQDSLRETSLHTTSLCKAISCRD
eukprot:6439835-Amphidinium_carterae.1